MDETVWVTKTLIWEVDLKIAIIGTGISGLGAAWLISKKHNITIFEKNNRIGGHSNTLDINYFNNNISVDTGFIVYNKKKLS